MKIKLIINLNLILLFYHYGDNNMKQSQVTNLWTNQ
jgi:hypothetical protein